MDSILNKLEKDRPLFHDDGTGNLISWNSNINLLKFLEEYLEPGMNTIEIGAGYSTVVFLYKQCFHTCIVQHKYEADRISDYSRSANISLERIEFIFGVSQDLLPAISKRECHVILIDGGHSFPLPIVDWFYCIKYLKTGGLIVIDDTDIISCNILLRFMLNDSHWEKVEIRENFAVFKKLGVHDYPGDWQGQPFSKEKIYSLNEFIKAFYPLGNSLEDGQIQKNLKKSTLFEKKESGSSNILSSDRNELSLSVIICTYNRAKFLKMTLESLIPQTLDKGNYEVIIIDDGSSDSTKQIVDSFIERLPIKYFYQNNAGLASAKNHGIYAAQGGILFFLDDDDVAMPTLLEEHVKTHREYPEDNYAVLHYTAWSPNISVTPLMHFVTEVGCFLFSYPNIKHGDVLDYTYFWGGRSSCKRSFLIDYGVFNPVFRFGCEDIEFGYRLSLHGLKVVFNSKAVCMMTRPITFDDFCQRLMKQGRSQYVFSTLHNDPNVHTWAEVTGAGKKWDKVRTVYKAKTRSARELDKIANMKLKLKFELDALTKKLLYESYWWVFKASKIKGILEAKKRLQAKSTHKSA